MKRHKILSREELEQQILPCLRSEGETIVFTNGCFDLLHKGHIDYLNAARSLGDVLILGLNSDASVSRLKGTNRPLQDEDSRATIMAALEMVDHLVVFGEDTPIDLIKMVNPDILVKGGDYVKEEIVGYQEVTNAGGEVAIIPFVEGYSTSAIEQKIKDNG